MSTKTISFTKRITKGPYEHEELKVEFIVEESQNIHSEMEYHKNFVYSTLGVLSNKPINTPAPTQENIQGEPNGKSNEDSSEESSSKHNEKSSSKSRSKKQKLQQEEVKSSSEEVEVDYNSPSEEMEEVTSPFKAQTEDKSSTKSEPKKGKKQEGIPYDSEQKEHRSTLTNYLTKLTGGKEWAADKEKSKKISKDVLQGQPFLGNDGKILPSFEGLCKTHFSEFIGDAV